MNSTFSLREADEGQHRYRDIMFSFFTVSLFCKIVITKSPPIFLTGGTDSIFSFVQCISFCSPKSLSSKCKYLRLDCSRHIFFPIIGQSQERSRQTNDTFQKKFSELFSFFFALLRLIKSTKAGAPDTQLTKCISFFISTTVFSSANIIGKGFF